MATSVAVLLLLGGGLLLLSTHPFVTYPLSLALLRRRLSGPPVAGARPSLAICLSVYNEEAVIEEKVESLIRQAAFYGPATVNIYADNCSDNTVPILTRYADRIRLIAPDERRGKTAGMAALIAASDSELLMFTDANVRAPDAAATALAASFADPAIGCVTVRLAYTNPDETPTSKLGALYWQLEERIKRLEDRTGGIMGVDGAMFMIRRTLYRHPPPELIDDLYVSLSVLLAGARVTRADIEVYERSATSSREEYGRKARIACQAMNVHRTLWPQIRQASPMLVYSYISHRLLKWMIPFELLGAGLFLAAAAAIRFGLLPTIAVTAAAAAVVRLGAGLGFRPLGLVWAALSSLAGVGRGVIESLVTRRTYTVWEPATSVREAGAQRPVRPN